MTDGLCAHWMVVDCIRVPVHGWPIEDIPVVCYWCEEVMTFGEWCELADA